MSHLTSKTTQVSYKFMMINTNNTIAKATTSIVLLTSMLVVKISNITIKNKVTSNSRAMRIKITTTNSKITTIRIMTTIIMITISSSRMTIIERCV